METPEAQERKPIPFERDCQELADLALRPESDPEKLRSFLRVQELTAAYRPELAALFQGLFQEREGEDMEKRDERFLRHARTVLGRLRETLPQELGREELRLLLAMSDVPGFRLIRQLIEDRVIPEEEKPLVSERVIRNVPEPPAVTPKGGRAPMCCPNIGGLEM